MSDPISRDDAIKGFEEEKRKAKEIRDDFSKFPNSVFEQSIYNEAVKAWRTAINIVKNLPTVEERKTEWIPVKSRPMDEEERKEWSERVGYELEGDDAVIYASPLPEDGQECIVCTKWGNVFIDTFQNDPDYGCAFEDHGDMDGITAWMPLPKPWKGDTDEQT